MSNWSSPLALKGLIQTHTYTISKASVEVYMKKDNKKQSQNINVSYRYKFPIDQRTQRKNTQEIL